MDTFLSPRDDTVIPLADILGSQEFQDLGLDEQGAAVNGWFVQASEMFTDDEQLAEMARVKDFVTEDIEIRRFNSMVTDLMPESKRENPEDFDYLKSAILAQAANSDRPLQFTNDAMSEDALMIAAEAVMQGADLPPMFPSDRVRVENIVGESGGDPAKATAAFFDPRDRIDQQIGREQRALNFDMRGIGFLMEHANRTGDESVTTGFSEFSQRVQPALSQLSKMGNARGIRIAERNWTHIDDQGTPYANGSTLMSIKKKPHPTRDDILMIRFPDHHVVETAEFGLTPTRRDLGDIAYANIEHFDDEEAEAVENVFGKEAWGIEHFFDSIFRGGSGVTGGTFGLLQAGYDETEDDTATVFQQIGLFARNNAEEVKRRHPKSRDALDAGAWGFDSPNWWLEQGTETATNLILQIFTGGLSRAGATKAGFGKVAQGRFAVGGFTLSGVLPAVGNTYHDAHDFHKLSGLNGEQAHNRALGEGVVVGIAIGMLERFSGKVLVGNKGASEALRGMWRKMSPRVVAGVRGGIVEGGTETAQEWAAILAEAAIRGDSHGLDEEIAALSGALGGDLKALKRSRALGAGSLGFAAGGVIGASRGGGTVNVAGINQTPETETDPADLRLKESDVEVLDGEGFSVVRVGNEEIVTETRKEAEQLKQAAIEFNAISEGLQNGSFKPDEVEQAQKDLQSRQQFVEQHRNNQNEAVTPRSLGTYPTWIQAQGQAKKVRARLQNDASAIPSDPAGVPEFQNDADAGRGRRLAEEIWQTRIRPPLIAQGKLKQDVPKKERQVTIKRGKEQAQALADKWVEAARQNREAGVPDLSNNVEVVEATNKNGQTVYEVIFNQPTTPQAQSTKSVTAEESAAVIAEAIEQVAPAEAEPNTDEHIAGFMESILAERTAANVDNFLSELEQQDQIDAEVLAELRDGKKQDPADASAPFAEVAKAVSEGVRFDHSFKEVLAEMVKVFGSEVKGLVVRAWRAAVNAVGNWATNFAINNSPSRIQDEGAAPRRSRGVFQIPNPLNFRSGLQALDSHRITPEGSEGDSDAGGAAAQSEPNLSPLGASTRAALDRNAGTPSQSPNERALAAERQRLISTGRLTGSDADFNGRLRTDYNAFERIGRGIGKFLEPISTTLGNVHPRLRGALRHFEFSLHERHERYASQAEGFVVGYQAMPDADQVAMDTALFNGDWRAARRLADAHGFRDALDSTEAMLAEVYTDSRNTGRDFGFIEGYFPRAVRSVDHFREFLEGSNAAGIVSRAIRDFEAAHGTASQAEQAEVSNRALQRLYAGRGKPHNMNARQIEEIQAEMLPFYKGADESIVNYVRQMSRDIESRRFFGHDTDITRETLLDGTIGGIFSELIAAGEIRGRDEGRIVKALNDRINYNFTTGGFAAARNIGYLATIANPISALTQIGDFAWSAFKNGYYALPGTGTSPGLTREDVGVTSPSAEFDVPGRLQKWLRRGFKWSGFDAMDRIGKQNLMNGWMRSMSSKDIDAFQAEISEVEPFLTTDAATVLEDIKAGRQTDDVRFLGFQQLSNFQPVSLSEMPSAYLTSPNGRIFYMLKSFTIKQIDVVRREAIQRMARGDVAGGMKALVTLAGAFAFAGATADELKQLILGREVGFGENVYNNLLKFMVLGRYHTEKLAQGERGAIKATVQDLGLSLPVIDLADRGFSTAGDVIEAVQDGEDVLDVIETNRLIEMIPIGGKIFYWRAGGGVEKEQKAQFDRMRKESFEVARSMRAERDEILKIPKPERDDAMNERLRFINRMEGTGVSGLRSKYEKIMKEALAAGDVGTAEEAHRQILKLQEDPDAAKTESSQIRKDQAKERKSGSKPVLRF